MPETVRLLSILRLVLLFLVLPLGGCTYGLLYTSTTKPYVLNFDKTPNGITQPVGSAKMISIPTTAISAGWSNRAIGEAAKNAGLEEIYYADLQTFSILLGLWEQKSLQVYGR